MKIVLDFQDGNDYVMNCTLAYKETTDEFKGEVVLSIDDYVFATIKTTRDELTKLIIDEYMKEIKWRIDKGVESFKTFVLGKVRTLIDEKHKAEEISQEENKHISIEA